MRNDKTKDLFQNALQAYRSKDYELTEKFLKQVIDLDDNDSETHMLLGSVYGKQEHFAQAIAEFRRTLEIKPHYSEAYNNMGVMYRSLGELDKAFESLDKASLLDSQNAGIYYNIGNVQKQRGQLSRALEAYKTSVKLNPSNPMAYNNIGTILEQQDKLDQARESYQKGLKEDATNPTLLYNLGILCQKLEDYPEARKALETVLKIKPGLRPAQNSLALVLLKEGKKDEAQELLEEVIEEDPHNLEALNNLGGLYLKSSQLDSAQQLFEKAINLNPRYEKAVLNLSEVLEKKKDFAQALDIVTHYSLMEPQKVYPHLRLAQLNFFLENFDKAEENLLTLLNLEPENIEGLKLLNTLYLKTDRPEETEKILKILKKNNIDTFDLHKELAHFYYNHEDFNKAQAENDKCLDLNIEDIEAIILKAKILEGLGKNQEAVKLLEDLRKNKPENKAVLGALARYYQEKGDQKGALEIVEGLMQSPSTKGASKEDLNHLVETLDMYEKAAESLTQNMQRSWEKNLRKLVKPQESKDEAAARLKAAEEPEWRTRREYSEDSEDKSLLDLGDLNPAVVLNESEETMQITEMDEAIPVDEGEEEELERDLLVESKNDPASTSGASSAPQAPAPAGAGLPPQSPSYAPPSQQNLGMPSSYPPYAQPPASSLPPQASAQSQAEPSYAPSQPAGTSGGVKEPSAPAPLLSPAPQPESAPASAAASAGGEALNPPVSEPAPKPEEPEIEGYPPEVSENDEDAASAEYAEEPEPVEPEDVMEDLDSPQWPTANPENEALEELPEMEAAADDEPVSEPEEENRILETDPEKVEQLIEYLEELTEFLPEDKKELLERDHIPLKMERIRNTLNPDSFSSLAEQFKDNDNPWPVKGEDPAVTKDKLRLILDKVKGRLNL